MPLTPPLNYKAPPALVAFKEAPTLVEATGWYKTRNGRYAYIHAITYPVGCTGEGCAFPCKGNLYRFHRGKWRTCSYEIWHVNGRCYVLHESGRDLIEPSTAPLEPIG